MVCKFAPTFMYLSHEISFRWCWSVYVKYSVCVYIYIYIAIQSHSCFHYVCRCVFVFELVFTILHNTLLSIREFGIISIIFIPFVLHWKLSLNCVVLCLLLVNLCVTVLLCALVWHLLRHRNIVFNHFIQPKLYFALFFVCNFFSFLLCHIHKELL